MKKHNYAKKIIMICLLGLAVPLLVLPGMRAEAADEVQPTVNWTVGDQTPEARDTSEDLMSEREKAVSDKIQAAIDWTPEDETLDDMDMPEEVELEPEETATDDLAEEPTGLDAWYEKTKVRDTSEQVEVDPTETAADDLAEEPMDVDEGVETPDAMDMPEQAAPEAKKGSKWDGDIRDQTIADIQDEQGFRDAINEAYAFDPDEGGDISIPEEEIIPTMTDDEIIKSLLNPEFREKRIDLDFDEIKIGDLMMTLSKTGQFNSVLDPALSNNKIDLHLSDVTIKEALLLLANAYNLGFKQVGGSLFVTTRDNIIKQNRVSKVLKMTNISVRQAMALVGDLALNVNASEDINSIIVTGQPDDIFKIEKIIETIDKPQPQVLLEAKIIELNKDALKEIGVDWMDDMTLSYQESGRPVDFSDPEDADRGVFEISRLQRNALQFEATIKMLENQNKAKVLSSPKITTLNEKEAEIFVGDEIPYTITNVTGGVVTTDVRWVEPGIRLRITPSIIGEDFVVIKVEPEVSFIFTFRGPNDEFPQVKSRKAVAYVRVQNKQPFVIGGLLNQEDKVNLYKVPFLGNLPLVGNLFSYEKHTVMDTELIITIIPTIVKNDN